MPPLILIIEDNPTDRAFLESTLRKENFSVLAAEDGRAGLAMAHEQKPDLIILDYMLPDINGLEVCRVLKEDAQTRKIPVIFLTIIEDGCTIVECFDAGAENLLTKPLGGRQLLEEVKLTLFEYNKEDPLEEHNF